MYNKNNCPKFVSFHIIVFIALPNKCLNSPCKDNAICQKDGLLSSLYTCICTDPFEEDGNTCSCKY